jgi:hypothetical protein
MAGAYIVECAICQQPWEVSEPIVSVPPKQAIQLPAHQIIERADSSPTDIECPGNQLPGLGMGERDHWEREWMPRYATRPLPLVLDGAAVELAYGRLRGRRR